MKASAVPMHQTLIDELLAEQGRLTAVEKFSGKHARHELPAQEKYYRDLIPLSLPRPGEQFAFQVDLDACSGCKACVTACHSLNGLDENETWRKVGKLVGGTRSRPIQQTITTACHHCVEPRCLEGCPVEAYEKDSVTGIVRHLDDQCIGCQYCSWTCPYDVPQFSANRGIVRKCDMCHGRLADGEAPACVQACPNGAITIAIVSQERMREMAQQNIFLPSSPRPSLTIPSTRFVGRKPLPPDVKAGEADVLKPQPAHAPLVLMLVLTQMAVGLFVINVLLRLFGAPAPGFSQLTAITAAVALFAGLAASVLHLGRPLQAWRSFLGWRHSWLSREVIAFGGVAGLAALDLFLMLTGQEKLRLFSSSLLCVAGALAVFCSAMLYHATRRDFWNLKFSGVRFFGSSVLLGAASIWVLGATLLVSFGNFIALALMIISSAKLAWEISFLRILDQEEESQLVDSARLMTGKLRFIMGIRLVTGLCGGLLLPFLFLAEPGSSAVPICGFVLCLLGEMLERYLFFTAVAPSTMPGGS